MVVAHFIPGCVGLSNTPGRALWMLLVMAMAFPSYAQNSITPKRQRLGQVYGITEPDMIEQMQEKMREMERNGKMAQLKQQFFERTQRNLESPKSATLPRAVEAKSYLIDPSYMVPSDLRDERGQVFARAGQRINALEMGTSLSKPLLFVDASDTQQMQAVPGLLRQYGGMKIILTGGKWRDVSTAIGQHVYVDQGGKLVKNFGIHAVPAIVSQSGNRLKVQEIIP